MSRTLAAALMAGAMVLFAGRTALAQDTTRAPAYQDTTTRANPVNPSTAEPATPSVTDQKADAGQKGDASAVTEHAEEALAQATELQKQQPGEDLAKAVENLRDAITKGKSGDANGAMASAQDALTKLKSS